MADSLRFHKMHGTGNDFVLIDGRSEPERDWPTLARRLCDRHYGAGSDGLLLLLETDRADFEMRMWNPDGTEAEMCGNGIRCFAKYVVDNRLKAGVDLSVDTHAGVKQLRAHVADGEVDRVSVSMGVPEFRPELIPVNLPGPRVLDYPYTIADARLSLGCVSMGNPHAVAFVDYPVSEFPLDQLGPKIEHDPLFPRRTNFEVCQLIEPSVVDVRVWERGAGATLACGTGACAVMAVAVARGLVGKAATIRLPGGDLDLRWDGAGEIVMTGAARLVYVGSWMQPL